jgi:hypothetical protein
MNEAEVLQFLHQYWPLLVPIVIIQYALVIFAIVDLSKQDVTRGPKIVWVFVILLVNFIGPILYFVIGRDEG